MNYNEFRNNFETDILKYEPINQFGEKVHYMSFYVVDLEDGKGDYYSIDNSTMVAEPRKGNHKDAESIGKHLRIEADKFLENQKLS